VKRDDQTFDAALEQLAPYGPDLANGMTSHAPMVMDALAELGRADALLPWIEKNRSELLPRPARVAPIARDAWRATLGRAERFADWSDFFAREIEESSWRDVVARWTERLSPGFCAAATHGVLRVGHAVRALEHVETPLRVRELADAFASWAYAYQVLPTGSLVPGALDARAAIAALPVVPVAERRFAGTIVSALEGLDAFPPFLSAIHLLDVRPPPERVLSDLTAGFARVLAANAHDWLGAIVFVHGVTSVAALRTLLPYLAPDAARTATQYAWQSSAGLYAAFATAPARAGEIEPPAESVESLTLRAVASGDDHAIKLVEACLREHAIAPSNAYLAAAAAAVDKLVAPSP
jgi:hypothetical protein